MRAERRRGGVRLAILLAALAVVAPAAGAAAAPRVLGIDWAGPASRLAWFDPAAMRVLPGPTAPLAWHNGSWSFDPARTRLAVGGNGDVLRLVDTTRMRVLGDVSLAPDGDYVGGVTWLRRDRVLAFVGRTADATLAVVDPGTRQVVRSVPLGQPVMALGRLPGALVLLLRPPDGIGPARLAVVDANGRVRSVVLDRIAVGSPLQVEENKVVKTRYAGLAVDPAGTAYVVAAEGIAQVDLRTLAVSYRTPPRALAKMLSGPFRTARWLGGGLVALAGGSYTTANRETALTPYGLRVLDVRSWTMRVLDPRATSFAAGDGFLVTQGGRAAVGYGLDGTERFRVEGSAGWVNVSGRYAEVCADRMLVAVLDPRTGARTPAARNGRCADLLTGRWSGF